MNEIDEEVPPVDKASGHEGHCIGCGKKIAAGERVSIWEEGWAHESCPKETRQ